jgi:pimeloyl-ACP methyl ester carboxylesterase
MLPKLVSKTTLSGHPEVGNRLRDMMMASSPAGIAAAARGLARRVDWTSRLGAINLPTLVVVGAEDAITPPQEVRRMADAIPQSQYVQIPGVGHVPPMEDTPKFNAALASFLQDLG